ncbi:hypothetical protein J4E80_010398 [Alternaria sp. BMP 0032]|nr:hypothetical protein J4E80_010398 [Alternaria sp. BMP 0032]
MPASNQGPNTGSTSGGSKGSTPMSQSDASRIQSSQDANILFTQAKSSGDMSSGGFAARAQGAGDRNANAGGQQSGGTKK